MEEFQSGQMGQTVNLLRNASVVRIHPPPPTRRKFACGEFFILFSGFLPYGGEKPKPHLRRCRSNDYRTDVLFMLLAYSLFPPVSTPKISVFGGECPDYGTFAGERAGVPPRRPVKFYTMGRFFCPFAPSLEDDSMVG